MFEVVKLRESSVIVLDIIDNKMLVIIIIIGSFNSCFYYKRL